MVLLRAGFALFISVTVIATAIGWGLMYLSSYGAFTPEPTEYLTPILHFAAVALATSIVLAVLAWRGRRQPMGDGTISVTLLVLGFSFAQVVMLASNGPSKYPDSMAFFSLWVLVGIYLACLVPAYLISYFALRRTPLLSPLAPPRQGPTPA